MTVVGATAAAAVASLLLLSACTSSATSSAGTAGSVGSPSTGGAADSSRTSGLLIGAADIAPGGFEQRDGVATSAGAPSLVGEYAAADGSRVVDTVVVFASAAQAQAALSGTSAAAGRAVADPQQRRVDGAQVFSGLDGGHQVVTAVFAQGRAVVTIAFRASTTTTFSDDDVDHVIGAQRDRVRDNLA